MQLTACWHPLYGVDNQDVVPPNNFVYDIVSDTGRFHPWWLVVHRNLAPFDSDPAGISKMGHYFNITNPSAFIIAPLINPHRANPRRNKASATPASQLQHEPVL